MPHGIDDIVWDELLGACIEVLTGVAQQERLVTYGDLSRQLARAVRGVRLDPHDGAMPHLLEEVNVVARSRDADSPMLSALVVGADSNEPDADFYGAAERLGREVNDRTEFWLGQVRSCHEWASSPGVEASPSS